MRRFLLLTACTLGALAAGALPASAATFYIDDNAAPENLDCTAAAPCTNIMSGVALARSSAEPDLVLVAAGLYDTERVMLNDPADSDITIQGAGTSSDPAAGTVIRSTLPGTVVEMGGGMPRQDHQTLRDVRIEVPQEDPARNEAHEAIRVLSTDALVRNVAIQMSDTTINANSAIMVHAGPTTLDRVTLGGNWPVSGITLFDGALSLVDSRLTLPSGTNSNGINSQAIGSSRPSLDIRRSSVALAASSIGSVLNLYDVPLTASSSLLTGGGIGLELKSVNLSTQASLRNVTIDAGAPGTSDAAAKGVHGYTEAPAQTTVEIDSSIVLEEQSAHEWAGGGTVSIACSSSDVPDQSTAEIACDTDAGNPNGNSTTPPAALFQNAAAGNYTLASSPVSPAVETGSAAALTPQESSTDLAGAGRVLDGDFDCVARRDKGAYELTSRQNSPPAVSVSGPSSAVRGAAVDFAADVSDEDPASALSFAWSFSDGGSASGQATSHAFQVLGSQSASVTVTDSHGCSGSAAREVAVTDPPPAAGGSSDGPAGGADGPAGGGGAIGPDTTPPTILAASLTNKVFAVARASSARRRRAPRGTTFQAAVSEDSLVTVEIARALPGRRVGATCLRPTPRLRGRKPCKRFVPLGSLSDDARGGSASLPFSGTLGGRALRPGRYRATLLATDGAGNKSEPRSLQFRVVRR